MLKAYKVWNEAHEWYDEPAVIVFAESEADAKEAVKRKEGDRQEDMLCDDIAELGVWREEWADKYAGEPHVPFREYLKHDWWWTCGGEGCDVHVDVENVSGERANGDILCEDCATKEGLTRPTWATPEREEQISE